MDAVIAYVLHTQGTVSAEDRAREVYINLFNREVLHLFLAGLKSVIREVVMPQDPEDPIEAIAFAKAAEAALTKEAFKAYLGKENTKSVSEVAKSKTATPPSADSQADSSLENAIVSKVVEALRFQNSRG